jgi:membrane associated rhomboid family serine protease
MTMAHLVGNLVTLWVFGRYVCPNMGNVPYALAYIAAGLGAGLVHIAYDGRPVIGASGAIMGVLGLYVVLCFEQFGRLGPWLILVWFLATLAAAVIGGSPDAYAAHRRLPQRNDAGLCHDLSHGSQRCSTPLPSVLQSPTTRP